MYVETYCSNKKLCSINAKISKKTFVLIILYNDSGKKISTKFSRRICNLNYHK